MQKLNQMLQVIHAFVMTHLIDEAVLAIHIENIVRTIAKVYVFGVVSKEFTVRYIKRFEELISPKLPEFRYD